VGVEIARGRIVAGLALCLAFTLSLQVLGGIWAAYWFWLSAHPQYDDLLYFRWGLGMIAAIAGVVGLQVAAVMLYRRSKRRSVEA
jgi:hypothetical protein